MTQTMTKAASWRYLLLAVGLAAFLLAGCGPAQKVGGAKASTVISETTKDAVTSTEEPVATLEPTPDPVATTVEQAAASPADFALSVKILTQDCFGTAGCNLTYRAQVDHGPTNGSYEVTFEVAVPGDDNSPYTDTLTVTDGKYDEPFEGWARPNRRIKSAAKIKVKVTQVEAR